MRINGVQCRCEDDDIISRKRGNCEEENASIHTKNGALLFRILYVEIIQRIFFSMFECFDIEDVEALSISR